MKVSFSIIVFVAIIFLFRNTFDPNTYKFSALEIDRNITRQQYLGEGLGKIYKNRYGVYYFTNFYPRFMKFESNFFSNLSSGLFYMPLYGLVLYKGLKKLNEK